MPIGGQRYVSKRTLELDSDHESFRISSASYSLSYDIEEAFPRSIILLVLIEVFMDIPRIFTWITLLLGIHP